MKTVFIAVSYQDRNTKNVSELLDVIERTIQEQNCSPVTFVRNQEVSSLNPNELMSLALSEILHSSLILIEGSIQTIGVGIEAGYAHANNVPILYVKNKKAKLSTTLSGISNEIIEYETVRDLETQLNATLQTYLK